VILYGSGHGLCGPVNEQIGLHVEELRRLGIAELSDAGGGWLETAVSTLPGGAPYRLRHVFSTAQVRVGGFLALLQETLPLIDRLAFPDSYSWGMKGRSLNGPIWEAFRAPVVVRILLVYQSILLRDDPVSPTVRQLLPLRSLLAGESANGVSWESLREPMSNQPLPPAFSADIGSGSIAPLSRLFRPRLKSLASSREVRSTRSHGTLSGETHREPS